MAAISSSDDEKVSQHQEELRDPTSQTTTDTLLPEDVLCDSCIDKPSKALKSCLTCLVSYCGAHLRPHLENAKFQNHRLVDPLQDIDCRTCEAHHLPLERFCMMDNCCMCLDCETQKHEGHNTASVGEARAHIENDLQKKQQEISRSAAAVENAIEKLQRNNYLIKSSVQDVYANVEEQFTRLQTAVGEARKRVMEVLDGDQRRALRQANGIQAHLEQRRRELAKALAQMNKLSRSKSDVDFLQEYSEWRDGVANVCCVPSVHMNRMDHLKSYVQVVADATRELCDLILSSYRDKLSRISNVGTKSQMPDVSSLPDPETPEDFLKYAVRSLTFEPDTIHHFLRVTDDNKKLTNTSPWQHSYPDHPDRFEYWRQAMTSESLYLGRHYIEAELSGEGAHVGVTYKSIDRKGDVSTSCITGNDFSWCVGRNSRGFSAWHAGEEMPLEVSHITRIGLYLDFQRGSVSFYDVTGPMKLLHNFKGDFVEPLYVAAWLSKKDNVVSLLNTK